MKTTFRWKNCDPSKAIEGFINDKVSIFDQFSFINPNVKFEIIHYAKQNIFKVRMNLISKVNKKTLRAEAEADNIYTATNNCFFKIEDQIRKIKTKIKKRRTA